MQPTSISTAHDPSSAGAAGDPARIRALLGSVERVIRGKDEVVRLVVTALLARGHVLIEDVPGVGKTTLAEALARSIGGQFHRIQFTSDLLPSDILGVNLWNAEARRFEFRRGPLFANVVLADEINRATPKTQSALLESMAEGTVTVDDRMHELPAPFFVLATQNPLDQSGTFPLPDSQLDRFLLRTHVGYPDAADEVAILQGAGRRALSEVTSVITLDELRALQSRVDAVRVDPDLAAYLVAIVGKTRTSESIAIGASPRASVDLFRASQARALMDGRHHVEPDDIKALAVPVLSHRLVLREGAAAGRRGSGAVRRLQALVAALVESVPVPV